MIKRIPEYPIHQLFFDRQSYKTMMDEPIPDNDIMMLFEAARWAPSSWNEQPWRFVYVTKKNMDRWQEFFNLLAPQNQVWAKNAYVLVVVCARTIFEFNGQPSSIYSFDVGAACQNLALQGYILGHVVRLIGGFDYAKAEELLNLPDGYRVQVMAVAGKAPTKGHPLREKLEAEKASQRKKLSEIVFHEKIW